MGLSPPCAMNNNITYSITEPVGSNGDCYAFSILRKDDSDIPAEPQRICISLRMNSDKEGWSYHFTVLSSLPADLAYLGQGLEYNRITTGNSDRKSTLRHALSQLVDLMESLGDTEARELLNTWFNQQF